MTTPASATSPMAWRGLHLMDSGARTMQTVLEEAWTPPA
jgi:hypothetical protein